MKTLVASLALLMLAGCMAPPAKREGQERVLDPRKACLAQCARQNDICGDQRSAQDGNTTYGMGRTCQAELQSCQAGCR